MPRRNRRQTRKRIVIYEDTQPRSQPQDLARALVAEGISPASILGPMREHKPEADSLSDGDRR